MARKFAEMGGHGFGGVKFRSWAHWRRANLSAHMADMRGEEVDETSRRWWRRLRRGAVR
jgi:hypothetical protein